MTFLFFFSLSSIKLLPFPNIYNNPARQNKKKEEENNHPTTKPKPNTTTKHHNLAQKINPKSTEKQLENPTQNQDKPTGKPNPKTVQTHRKPGPKSSRTHHKIIKIVLNLDPNSSNPYTNSYK